MRLLTDFAVGDLLSFAFPKESKQRKGNPDQTAFPHSDKIFFTKNQPDIRFALARRDFPKNFISIRAVWMGNVTLNFKGGGFLKFLKFCEKWPHFCSYKIGKFYFGLIFKQNVEERKN
ncbi:hypothetical protein EIA51_08155 [Avibacterium paragallinarum]|nr:hypothetical protein EIA51_08155 [Avibacterium paragallinarum]